MLSEKSVAILVAQTYRADSDWGVNILPLGSIYWHDELPDMLDLFKRPDDMSIIYAMFAIRLKLWDGETLSAQDRNMWDAVRQQVPNWALFNRLSLSDEQRLARGKAERQVEKEIESLGLSARTFERSQRTR
ncbi:MAG: hypothetical protein ABSG96_16695 [Terracidiphilus sp.]|jgi:hypothetical protein